MLGCSVCLWCHAALSGPERPQESVLAIGPLMWPRIIATHPDGFRACYWGVA